MSGTACNVGIDGETARSRRLKQQVPGPAGGHSLGHGDRATRLDNQMPTDARGIDRLGLVSGLGGERCAGGNSLDRNRDCIERERVGLSDEETAGASDGTQAINRHFKAVRTAADSACRASIQQKPCRHHIHFATGAVSRITIGD